MLGPESSLKTQQTSPIHDLFISQIRVQSFEKFNQRGLVNQDMLPGGGDVKAEF